MSAVGLVIRKKSKPGGSEINRELNYGLLFFKSITQQVHVCVCVRTASYLRSETWAGQTSSATGRPSGIMIHPGFRKVRFQSADVIDHRWLVNIVQGRNRGADSPVRHNADDLVRKNKLNRYINRLKKKKNSHQEPFRFKLAAA